jgi:E3 ubiquitin-protein ligase NEDD4
MLTLAAPVIACDGLAKRDIFSLPDPFAVITVDGEQTRATSVIKKTVKPYWNEQFHVRASSDSILTVKIFDQRKFKNKDQGFLGVVNVRVGDILDPTELEADEQMITLEEQMITRDLKPSRMGDYSVKGKIILALSINNSSLLWHHRLHNTPA